jgi:hypothetical protein
LGDIADANHNTLDLITSACDFFVKSRTLSPFHLTGQILFGISELPASALLSFEAVIT